MNKIIFATMPWLFAAISYKATAQNDVKTTEENKKQSQEIIIRKKGNKDANVTIEFKDDKVIINGKPLIEFKDDAITINNRTFKFKQLEKDMEAFGRDMEGFGRDIERSFNSDKFKGRMEGITSNTFLGVTTEKNDAGAKVQEVTKGSAAEIAGIKEGDIITKIDDKKVNNPGELAEIIGQIKPATNVKIYYQRNGKDKTTKALLQQRKETDIRSFSFTTPDGSSKIITVPNYPAAPMPPMPPGSFGWNNEDVEIEGNFNFNSRPKLGLKIQDIEESGGVRVLEVEEGSAAEKAGLKKDDVITEIGSVKVNNTDEAREQLQANASKFSYPVIAKRNNADIKFEIKIPKKLKTANL